jgi:hypothetical protein
MNTLRSKYFLYINLGTHYCDEPNKLLYLITKYKYSEFKMAFHF